MMTATAAHAGVEPTTPWPSPGGGAPTGDQIINTLRPGPGPVQTPMRGLRPFGPPATWRLCGPTIVVRFREGSGDLDAAAHRELRAAQLALAHAAELRCAFRIEGHTDSGGEEAADTALSERRAAAVAAFLARQVRISPSRLAVVGVGESQPVVPTPQRVAEPRNRVVLIITAPP